MVSVTLMTSVAPGMSRLDAKGDEIGEEYQVACIESWKLAGFQPVSVNSKNEAFGHALRMIPVDRDATAITGRPHVFLADLLAVASMEAKGRPFALMNADLILGPTADLAARVAQLRPGELLFSRRIDIDESRQTDGVPYRYGYDFFAGHADDLSGLSDAGMVFGAPWWDHFFPLLMLMQGCRLYQTEPAVLHLKHTERWSWPLWEALGQRFVAEMGARAGDNTYGFRLEDAVKNAEGEPYQMLHRVSDVNLSLLNEISLKA